jgi:predicted kinase
VAVPGAEEAPGAIQEVARGVLIILAGLPGVGKTTIARELALRLVGVHVRIDSIEQAIRQSATHATVPMDDAGYLVGYAVAEDNLRLGHTVIADSVNPWPLTRDAWVAVAERAGVRSIEVEIICSDADEHERRVAGRAADAPGMRPLTWQQVLARDYRHWHRDRTVVDTASKTVLECVEEILAVSTSAAARPAAGPGH